jgi:hypothetical protein
LAKVENTAQKEYYEKYFPKFDLFNGNPIPFSRVEDYSTRLFIDKRSEFAYLRRNGLQAVSGDVLMKQLADCSAKSRGRLPTYCEWRSSKNLRYDFMDKEGFFLEFVERARANGINSNFDYSARWLQFESKECEILVDTREQQPLFDCEKTTINVGDYTLSKENYNGVHVDRKSKADFIGTFTKGLDRFRKECEKARAMDITIVVLIEETYQKCFTYLPLKFTKQKVTGESAFHGLRKISREFPEVQFLFVDGREEAKEYIKMLLNNKNIIESVDLQFMYELGELDIKIVEDSL